MNDYSGAKLFALIVIGCIGLIIVIVLAIKKKENEPLPYMFYVGVGVISATFLLFIANESIDAYAMYKDPNRREEYSALSQLDRDFEESGSDRPLIGTDGKVLKLGEDGYGPALTMRRLEAEYK